MLNVLVKTMGLWFISLCGYFCIQLYEVWDKLTLALVVPRAASDL